MNDKEKNTWQIGEAKIYSEKFLANPLVVGSYQGISEIYKFIINLQAENKKLREALAFYADPSTWQHLSDDAWDEDIIGLNSFDDCLKHCEVDGVKILTGGKRAIEALKEVGRK